MTDLPFALTDLPSEEIAVTENGCQIAPGYNNGEAIYYQNPPAGEGWKAWGYFRREVAGEPLPHWYTLWTRTPLN
jgi:hypothetical protein